MPRELDTPLAHAWKAQGLNGEQVADGTGISVTYLYEIARGDKNPSMKTAIRLSQFLKRPLQELFPHLFLPTGTHLAELRDSKHAATG